MLIDNADQLKEWLAKTLEPLCEADPPTLAKYILALVKKDKPEEELQLLCQRELQVFLNDRTEEFVGRLFAALHSRSYLPSGGASFGNFPGGIKTEPVAVMPEYRPSEIEQIMKVPNELNRTVRDQRSAYKPSRSPRSDSRSSRAAPYAHRSKSPRAAEHDVSRDRYHRSPARMSSNSSVMAQKLVKHAHRELTRQNSGEGGSGRRRQDSRGESPGHWTGDPRMYQSNERLGPPSHYIPSNTRNVSPASSARSYDRYSKSSYRYDTDDRYSPSMSRRDRRYSRSRTRSRSPTRSSTGRASMRYSPGAMSRTSSVSYRSRRRSHTPPSRHQVDRGGRVLRGQGSRGRSGSVSDEGRGAGSVSPDRCHSTDSTGTSLSSEMPANTGKRLKKKKSRKMVDKSAEDDDLYGECLRLRSHNRTTHKIKCQDYEERGYCVRGLQCPYDHGLDPVVVTEPGLTSTLGLPGIVSSQLGSHSLHGQHPLAGILPDLNLPPPPLGSQAPTLLPPPHFLPNMAPPLAGHHRGASQGMLSQSLMQPGFSSVLLPPTYNPGEGRSISPQNIPTYQPSVNQAYATPPRPQAPPSAMSSSSMTDVYVPQPVSAASAASAPEPYNPQPYIPQPVGDSSDDVYNPGQMKYSVKSSSNTSLSSSSSQMATGLKRASTYESDYAGAAHTGGTDSASPVIRAGVKRASTDTLMQSSTNGSAVGGVFNKRFAADKSTLQQSPANHPGVRQGSYWSPKAPAAAATGGGSNRDHHNNTTLEIRRIPKDLNTIARVNEHFLKFGIIINLQVGFENDPEAAIVSFASHAQAMAAYRSSEPMFNNRFIKIFWHNTDRQQAQLDIFQNLDDAAACSQDMMPVAQSFTPSRLQSSSENQKNLDLVPASSESFNPGVPAAMGGQESTEPSDGQQQTENRTAAEAAAEMMTHGNEAAANSAATSGYNKINLPNPSQFKLQRQPTKEQIRKEALNKKKELMKQTQTLLEKQLAEQKLLIEKHGKTQNKEDRAVIMKALSVLSVTVQKTRDSLTSIVASMTPATKPAAPIAIPVRSQLSKVNVRRLSGSESQLSPGVTAARTAAASQLLSGPTAAAASAATAVSVEQSKVVQAKQSKSSSSIKSASKARQTSSTTSTRSISESSSTSEMEDELAKLKRVVEFSGFETSLGTTPSQVEVTDSVSGTSSMAEGDAAAAVSVVPADAVKNTALEQEKEKLRLAELKLEALKREAEAKTLYGGGRGAGWRGRGARGGRGRGYTVMRGKGPVWVRSNTVLSVDRRPRELRVSGFSNEEREGVMIHLSNYGEIESHVDVDETSLNVTYALRHAAEKALREGSIFNGKSLTIQWTQPSSSAVTSSSNQPLDSSSGGSIAAQLTSPAASSSLLSDGAADIDLLLDDRSDAGSKRSDNDLQERDSRLSLSTTDVSVDLPDYDISLEDEDDDEEEERSWRR